MQSPVDTRHSGFLQTYSPNPDFFLKCDRSSKITSCQSSSKMDSESGRLCFSCGFVYTGYIIMSPAPSSLENMWKEGEEAGAAVRSVNCCHRVVREDSG